LKSAKNRLNVESVAGSSSRTRTRFSARGVSFPELRAVPQGSFEPALVPGHGMLHRNLDTTGID